LPTPMNVTLRQLRAFLAVAVEGHFTRAADKLDVSQSTISTLIRELEANLGLRLFDRHTRALRLTQAGEEIVPLARKSLSDLDQALESLSQLKALSRGRVAIAASSLQAALILPRLIQIFAREHPGIVVTVYDVPQPEVLELVRAGEADFGIGTESGSRHDLSAQVIGSDTFIALLPPAHPLGKKAELTWRDLAPVPIIGSRHGNPLREQLDLALAREGITLTRSHEVSLPLTIVGMVEAGMGIAVMTTTVSKLAASFGLTVKKVGRPVITREISLLFHADRSLSPAAQKFRELLVRIKFAAPRD
jgi:LysR family carnitine catabolism transcriptional activator